MQSLTLTAITAVEKHPLMYIVDRLIGKVKQNLVA